MLVGVLGGPVGVLVGWGGGALIGGAFDVDRAVKSEEALTALGRAMPPDATEAVGFGGHRMSTCGSRRKGPGDRCRVAGHGIVPS